MQAKSQSTCYITGKSITVTTGTGESPYPGSITIGTFTNGECVSRELRQAVVIP